MTRLSIATGKNAQNPSPIEKSYDRITKDGTVPIITMLLGTNYNERIDGIVISSTEGNITNNQMVKNGSKLALDAGSVDETLVKQIGTHSSFMYFWAGTEIFGNSELETDTVTDIITGTPHTHSIRQIFEDLASGDKLIIEWKAGSSNAILNLIEEVSGVETVLETFNAPAGIKIIDWKFIFAEKGLSRFLYKTLNGEITKLWDGQITADIRECKVLIEHSVTETTTRRAQTDFIWLGYLSTFSSFDTTTSDLNQGIIKVYDTKNEAEEADWINVWSKDHAFSGERVVENGMIRMWFKSNAKIEVYGYNSGSDAWDKLGNIVPQDNTGTDSISEHEIIFQRLNDSQTRIVAKYGIIDYLIDFKKGDPYMWINTHSKHFKFETTKERFALSSDDPDTNLTKWNQKGTDDANRGNPLGTYQGATNPQVFTNDSDVDTGLQHVDDNWFAFYNLVTSDVVAFIGGMRLPSGLTLNATDSTTLESAEFTFNKENIVTVGMLQSTPTQIASGISRPFQVTADDTYVKWRANESIFTFAQRKFIKRRR